MNSGSKTISSIVMLILLSLPGFLIVHYQLMQLHTQHQMEEKLEKEHIQIVHIPVGKIQWHKKNKEIIIDGKLFDIKSITLLNGVAECKGLFDEKETSIKKIINQLQRQQEEDNPLNISAAKFFSLVLFSEDSLPNSFPGFLFPQSVHYICADDLLIFTNLSTPSPPPKA